MAGSSRTEWARGAELYEEADRRSHGDHNPWRHARRLVGGLCTCAQSRGGIRIPRFEIYPRGPRRLAENWICSPPADHLEQGKGRAHANTLLVPTRAMLVRAQEERPVVWEGRREL